MSLSIFDTCSNLNFPHLFPACFFFTFYLCFSSSKPFSRVHLVAYSSENILFQLKKNILCIVLYILFNSVSPRLVLDSSGAQLKLFWINTHIEGIGDLHFKIMYTHNNWRNEEHIHVGKSESSCIIPNILPEKMYRFTITSILENSFEGEPSDEVTYNSGSTYTFCVINTYLRKRFIMKCSRHVFLININRIVPKPC